ncbi:hypothetical protein [Nocardia sp. NPDC059239]|uniref:hypothetical protein n=1 Tax=unclassified Nocardia TaxID=2637762 RepID=UPI003689FFF4
MLRWLAGLLIFLLTVCVVRLVVLRLSGRWLTGGLWAIALGFVLYMPDIDNSIDTAIRRSPIGLDNVANLAHILLTLTAWWTLGVLSLRVLRTAPALEPAIQRSLSRHARLRRFVQTISDDQPLEFAVVRIWTIANGITAVAAIVVWRVSALPDVAVHDLLQLHDIGTRVLVAMYGGWAFVGGVLVVTASVIGLRYAGPPRPALWVMLGIGSCGIGYSVTAALALAIAGTEFLRVHAQTVMGIWAIPGLALLSFSGIPGIVKALRGRGAPRAAAD